MLALNLNKVSERDLRETSVSVNIIGGGYQHIMWW